MEKFFRQFIKKGKIFDPSIGDQTAEVKLASAQDVSKAIRVRKMLFINGQIPHPSKSKNNV